MMHNSISVEKQNKTKEEEVVYPDIYIKSQLSLPCFCSYTLSVLTPTELRLGTTEPVTAPQRLCEQENLQSQTGCIGHSEVLSRYSSSRRSRLIAAGLLSKYKRLAADRC